MRGEELRGGGSEGEREEVRGGERQGGRQQGEEGDEEEGRREGGGKFESDDFVNLFTQPSQYVQSWGPAGGCHGMRSVTSSHLGGQDDQLHGHPPQPSTICH